MTDFTTIEASTRAKAGKGAARATRRAGEVPAVIYGAKQEASLIALDPRIIVREMHRGGWRSRLYQVKAGGTTTRALIREIQLHPVTDRPIHVDFQRLVGNEPVHVTVAVVFKGEDECVGVKRGGVLNIVRHTIDVSVDPDHIPEHFEADVSALEIGDIVRWHDLKGTENVSAPDIEAHDYVIATIAAPSVEEEPEAETAENETAAAAGSEDKAD
jgi:large subunit ribosomal protein L25